MDEVTALDDADLRELSARLGDRANTLAAEGRTDEIPYLWEQAISALPGNSARAQITLAYAWYQVLHGAIHEGIALAAHLLHYSGTPDPVRAQARVLIRSRRHAEPGPVEQAWIAAAGSPLPGWARLTDARIQVVADWVSAPTWELSQAFYHEHAELLQADGTGDVLDEFALRGPARLTSAAALHHALRTLSAGATGAQGAYSCLADQTTVEATATAAIGRGAWAETHACGTIEVLAHRRAFLGSMHVVIAQVMQDQDRKGTSDTRLLAKLSTLARAAPDPEQARAAADIRLLASLSSDGGVVADLLSLCDPGTQV